MFGLFCLKARDIYEEAIQTVTTVRDFTQVFDAYAQFEELSLSKRMEEVAKNLNPSEEGMHSSFFSYQLFFNFMLRFKYQYFEVI